jgi:hypothetical protein
MFSKRAFTDVIRIGKAGVKIVWILGIGQTWGAPLHAEIITISKPVTFSYTQGSAGDELDTGWQTLIPYESEGKLGLACKESPINLNFYGILHFQFDTNDFYANPGSAHYVSNCLVWLDSSSHPYRQTFSSKLGAEAKIALRPLHWPYWPEIGFGKDFYMNIEANGPMPFGDAGVGGCDYVEFLSIPISDAIEGFSDVADAIFSTLDSTGLGLCSFSLAGEMVITGRYLDIVCGETHVQLEGCGISYGQNFTVRIPAGYAEDYFYLDPNPAYFYDAYQSFGLCFSLVDPLSVCYQPDIVDKNINDTYAPPDQDTLDGPLYRHTIENASIEAERDIRIAVPMTDSPKLPDIAITDVSFNPGTDGKVYADGDTEVRITITNTGHRANVENARCYLHAHVDGVRTHYIPLMFMQGGYTLILDPGESHTMTILQQLPAGSVALKYKATFWEYAYTDADGDPIYEGTDADYDNNVMELSRSVLPVRGEVLGRLVCNPDSLGGNVWCGTHYYDEGLRLRLEGAGFVKKIESGTDGWFTFGKVPEGDYSLTILPADEPDPDDADYWPRTLQFHHDAGVTDNLYTDARFRTYTYEQTLLQMQDLAGTVVRASDTSTPVVDASVAIGEPAFRTTTTDGDGNFLITGVPPRGTFNIVLKHPDYERRVIEVNMADHVMASTKSVSDLGLLGLAVETVAPYAGLSLGDDEPRVQELLPFVLTAHDHDKPADRYKWEISGEGSGTVVLSSAWVAFPGESGQLNGTIDISAISEGDYTISFLVQDSVGNESATAAKLFHCDRTPPAVDVVINDDAVFTADGAVEVEVSVGETASAAMDVYLRNPGDDWTARAVIPPGESSVSIPSWVLVAGETSGTTETVEARVIDAAGNEGTASDSIVVDCSDVVTLAGGAPYSDDTTVSLDCAIEDPGELISYHHEARGFELPLGSDRLNQFRAQKIRIEDSITFTHVRVAFTTQVPGAYVPYVGEPGPLTIRLVAVLDDGDPTDNTIALWQGERAAVEAWRDGFPLDSTVLLGPGDYWLVVHTQDDSDRNFYTLDAGLSNDSTVWTMDCPPIAPQELERYDFDPGSGWTQAKPDEFKDEFYQVAADLLLFDSGEVQVAADGVCDTEPWLDWPDEAPATVTFPGEGRRTVAVHYRNTPHALEDTWYDAVLVDTTPPVATPVLVAVDEDLQQILVDLFATDPLSGVADYLWHAASTTSDWQPYTTRVSVPYGTVSFDHISFQVRDRAGNDDRCSLSLDALSDIFPPEVDLFIFYADNPITNNPHLFLTFDAQDNEQVQWVVVEELESGEITAWPYDEVAGGNRVYLDLPQVDSDTPYWMDGTYTYQAWAVDTANNESLRDTAVVTLDRVPPTIEQCHLEGPQGRPFTTTNAFNLLLDVHDAIGPLEFQYSLNYGTWSTPEPITETLTTIPFTDVPVSDTYSLRVWVLDAAGNRTDASTSIDHAHHPSQPVPLYPERIETFAPFINFYASAFSDPDPGDDLSLAQWRIHDLDGGILFDTGPLEASWGEWVASLKLDPGEYLWSVRYADSRGLWSDWSAPCEFAVKIAVDADEDGLLDDWETTFFPDTSECIPSIDHDHDGRTTGEEFEDGTNPLDPDSRFCLNWMEAGTGFTLHFDSVYNRIYRMQATETIEPGKCSWEDVSGQGPRPGVDGPDSMHDSTPIAPRRFYRLKIEPPYRVP